MSKILIDTRESDGTKEVLKIFLDCEERMLEVGDIVYGNTLVFEHKTDLDLIASVFDGRLFSQISEMQENYTHSYVLVSASMTNVLDAAEAVNRHSSIMAAICSCFRRGCPIIFCDDLTNLTDVVKTLGEKLTDDKKRSRPIIKISMEDKRLQFICSLPGVSETRGAALLEHFGSVENVLAASSDELQKVHNIGEVIAEGIRDVLDA